MWYFVLSDDNLLQMIGDAYIYIYMNVIVVFFMGEDIEEAFADRISLKRTRPWRYIYIYIYSRTVAVSHDG